MLYLVVLTEACLSTDVAARPVRSRMPPLTESEGLSVRPDGLTPTSPSSSAPVPATCEQGKGVCKG